MIAAFFRSYPENQAINGLHDHLTAFWTPSPVPRSEAQ
ncbi:formate dehydrogenase subunit delta [Microvirga roseola]|nr:formate dehydrogenase subunit delta [Microvirga roseola]